jgi:hypothetical protein
VAEKRVSAEVRRSRSIINGADKPLVEQVGEEVEKTAYSLLVGCILHLREQARRGADLWYREDTDCNSGVGRPFVQG